MENKESEFKSTQKPGALALAFLLFSILKASILPFLKTARFVKEDIVDSARHDAKLAIAMSFLTLLIFVLGVLLWITIGAGLVIWLVAGSGAVLTAWAYILLFEFLTIFALALLILLAKSHLKIPESIKRAEKLLKLK